MPFDSRPENFDGVAYRERLLQLCRVIESVSDSSFDLKDWNRNGMCTTVSCAVGWAMKDDWFRRQGLRRKGSSPSYGDLTGWVAVRSFFGLDRQGALDLFHASSYEKPTREAVKAKLRRYAEQV